MALIEKYHVVAAMQTVDPQSLEIKEGMCVALNGAAGVRRVTTNDQKRVYGIAGDSYSQTASYMPGVQTGWQNRVSDGYDETKASGKMTVYHSGGEFATDMFVNTNMGAAYVNQYLKADEATGKLALDQAVKTMNSIAMLTRAAGPYPSGVPGTDVNGDISLGTYIEFKLII